MKEIWVLRLGHRPSRDKRVTTHVALTARAMGAKGIFISTEDREIEEGVKDVVSRFGGEFEVKTGVNWRSLVKEFEGTTVHLTMYGEPIDQALEKVRSDRMLLIVGAEKVPAEVYQLADMNIAVGNQPHSEVAALAIVLDRLTGGEGLRARFDGQVRIVPTPRGKRVDTFPTEEECIRLLEEEGCGAEVIRHCCVVMAGAVMLAEKCGADLPLVRVGALLHDVGRSRGHGIEHLIAGAEIAKARGLPESVVRIIQRHVGAGLTPEEAERLDLPPGDYMPQILEEKLVGHVDNLVDGVEFVSLEKAMRRFQKNGLEDAAERMISMERELAEICGESPSDILRSQDPLARLRGACSERISRP
jgi:tRNA (cytidine56-2'-O)-methyltransferase